MLKIRCHASRLASASYTNQGKLLNNGKNMAAAASIWHNSRASSQSVTSDLQDITAVSLLLLVPVHVHARVHVHCACTVYACMHVHVLVLRYSETIKADLIIKW